MLLSLGAANSIAFFRSSSSMKTNCMSSSISPGHWSSFGSRDPRDESWNFTKKSQKNNLHAQTRTWRNGIHVDQLLPTGAQDFSSHLSAHPMVGLRSLPAKKDQSDLPGKDLCVKSHCMRASSKICCHTMTETKNNVFTATSTCLLVPFGRCGSGPQTRATVVGVSFERLRGICDMNCRSQVWRQRRARIQGQGRTSVVSEKGICVQVL